MTAAVRALVDALAATEMANVALPVPLAGETVTQLAPDDAVHAQPVVVVTLTVVVPAAFPTDGLSGDTVNVHGAAAWVTVTVWPAMVTVPVREVVAVLAV